MSKNHPEYLKFRRKFKVTENDKLIIITFYDERPKPGTILAGKELEESKKMKDPVCDPYILTDILNIVANINPNKEIIYGYSLKL